MAELSNQILVGRAQTYNVTTDWILLGPKDESETEIPAVYEVEAYTQEEEEVIEEYRAANTAGRETGRVVFRINLKDQKNQPEKMPAKTDQRREEVKQTNDLFKLP